MRLQNLQAEWAEALFSEEASLDFIQPVSHLAIYRNQVMTQLTNALTNRYSLTRQLLGDDVFHQIAKEYIAQYPSCSSNLHDYGEYFSHFLVHHPAFKEWPYLPDIAQCEWLCHLAYFAADPSPIDGAILEKISPEQYDHFHLILHPASYLMQSDYPLLQIIELCNDEMEEPLDIKASDTYLLIIRRERDIALVSLTQGEYGFLAAIQEGQTVANALQEAHFIDPHFTLEEKLPAWVQNQTIVGCYTHCT